MIHFNVEQGAEYLAARARISEFAVTCPLPLKRPRPRWLFCERADVEPKFCIVLLPEM
jgi:hypothetical protein